jgi:hypothetical protein
MKRALLALLAAAPLFVLAAAIGHDEWTILAQPSPTRVLDLPLAESKALFLLGCLAVIVTARLKRSLRDPLHLLLGATWFTLAWGWQYTAGMTAVALFVYFLSGRLHPHLAMLATAVLLLFGARYLFGNAASETGGLRFSALTAARLVYYAFELRAIPRARRSLLSFFVYAPFSLLLWPGPAMLSYITWTTPKPQEELDRLGARQLVRAAAKTLACAMVLVVTHEQLPQAARILIPYPLLFLTLSMRQDLAAALCNFAGHHAPNPFNWPLLADTPFELWRRWGVPLVDFLRRAFIFEAARRHRSIIVIAAAGMGGSALYHAFYGAFFAGPDMKLGPALTTIGNYFAIGVPFLLLFAPIEKIRKRMHPVWRVPFILITQGLMTWLIYLIHETASPFFSR